MRKLIITIAAAMLSVFGLSAQNFVHYHWFDGENSTVPAGTRGRVVFMGDSITEGWGTKGTPGFFDNDKMVERGISGEVTAQMVLRFRRDVIDLKPKTAVLLRDGVETEVPVEQVEKGDLVVVRPERAGERVVLAQQEAAVGAMPAGRA